MFTYHTRGTCSAAIDLEVEGDVLRACAFHGGCTGNAQGLAKLVVGMPVDEVIEKLKGIQCRNGTSCPDQLSRALAQWKARQVG
jgi:uncharacterized protein (TIGR03905 family)